MSDLREQFEASFGSGPPLGPVAPVVAAGKRAVRRRRVAAAGALVAVLAVMGTTYSALAPDAARTPGVAVAPDAPDPSDPSRAVPWHDDEVARFDRAGALYLRPGVEVREKMVVVDTQELRMVGLDVVFEGERHWTFLTFTDDGSGLASHSSQDGEPTGGSEDFHDWVETLAQDQGDLR